MQILGPQVSTNTSGQGTPNPDAVPVKGLSPNGLVAGMVLAGLVVDTDETKTVITLAGGNDVELPAQPDLVARDRVSLTVVTVRPQVQVRVNKVDANDAQSPEDVGLRDGQTTAAKVLAKQADGTVQIDLNGRVVSAEAPRDVEPGSLLPVRVTQQGGRLVLTVLRGEKGTDALAQHFLREHARSRESLGRILSGLLDKLQLLVEKAKAAEPTTAEQLASAKADLVAGAKGGFLATAKNLLMGMPASNASTDMNSAATAGTLAPHSEIEQPLMGLKQLLEFLQIQDEPQKATIERSVQDGGLFLESKLGKGATEGLLANDLKAALLKAVNSSSGGDTQLNGLLQDATSELERLQLSNVLSQIHDGALLWQLPGWPNSSPISLRIERDEETTISPDAPDSWQFLVSVDLDRLGPVRVDSRLQADTFRAIFYVEPSHLDEFQSELAALQQELSGPEFSKVLLTVRDSREIPPSLARKFRDASEGSSSNINVLDVEG